MPFLPINVFLNTASEALIITNALLQEQPPQLQKIITLLQNIQIAACRRFVIHNFSSTFKEYLGPRRSNLFTSHTFSINEQQTNYIYEELDLKRIGKKAIEQARAKIKKSSTKHALRRTQKRLLVKQAQNTALANVSQEIIAKTKAKALHSININKLSCLQTLTLYIQEYVQSHFFTNEPDSIPLVSEKLTETLLLLTSLEKKLFNPPGTTTAFVEAMQVPRPLKRKWLSKWEASGSAKAPLIQQTTFTIEQKLTTSTVSPLTTSISHELNCPIPLVRPSTAMFPMESLAETFAASDEEDTVPEPMIPTLDVNEIIPKKIVQSANTSGLPQDISIHPSLNIPSPFGYKRKSPTKDEELPTSVKKQKIAKSIEESEMHVKEALLPIIQAPPSANKYHFVALTFMKTDKSLIITYREKIASIHMFLNFLKQVRQSISSCLHYNCAKYIPEIPQQQSSNTLDLLKALYASIVRNHYFFVKNHGPLSTTIQKEVDYLLNLVNQKYYINLQEKDPDFLEEADNFQHHLDLKIFTETPPKPILTQFNFSWYMLKKQSQSKSLWIIHTLISFDQCQQLKSISENAKKMLNHIQKIRLNTSLLLDCNDGSVQLPHLPKQSITSYQGFYILQALITHNRKCFNEHIAVLEQKFPDTFWKERTSYKTTVKILDEIDKCLREWQNSLKLQYPSIPLPVPKTAHTTTSISIETTQEINSPQPIQDTSFVENEPIFFKIMPNNSFNSFVIHPCKRPIIKNFKSSCKIAKKLLDSSFYICEKIISKNIPISSKNPLVITKTLFTVLCISAFGYRKKTASSKKMSALTPDLIHSLFDSLKALDHKYCQLSDHSYDPSLEIYHPDFQAIITRSNILSLVTAQAANYSFTYTFLSISFKTLQFSTIERTYSHCHPLNLLKLVYDQLCHSLRNIIKLILSSEISTLTAGTISDPSSLELLHTESITSLDCFTRQETLIFCRKMLKKLQAQILTDPLFRQQSDICNNIQNNLRITLTWLNAHIAHHPLPTTPLPSDLYSLPITVIQISKEAQRTYHISHPKLWLQEKNSQLKNLKNCAKTTYKWLSYLFDHPLQSNKEKIIYQGQTFLDVFSLVPMIYRTVEYEMLQVKKIILITLQRSLSYPSIQKPAKTGFRFLLKCHSLIETKWQELHLNTPIPTLEDLPADIKALLPFTLQDVELLKEDPIFSEFGINLMEIFTYNSDDSDQEEVLFSDDITPKTSSK